MVSVGLMVIVSLMVFVRLLVMVIVSLDGISSAVGDGVC